MRILTIRVRARPIVSGGPAGPPDLGPEPQNKPPRKPPHPKTPHTQEHDAAMWKGEQEAENDEKHRTERKTEV